MSKDAQDSVALDASVQKKFDECVAALTAMRYGPEGPPKETTFAEIEQFGHLVGRMLARAVDERLTVEHGRSFQNQVACPTCHTICEPNKEAAERELQTSDGKVPISEPVCHCSVCNRDFFPQRVPGKECRGTHMACERLSGWPVAWWAARSQLASADVSLVSARRCDLGEMDYGESRYLQCVRKPKELGVPKRRAQNLARLNRQEKHFAGALSPGLG